MHYLQAIFLGLVQGLTEFIPVSSSGHVILVEHWLHFDGGAVFDVALNIGTLAALLLFFWQDFWNLFKSLFKRNEHTRMAWMLVIATIPGVIAGILLEHAAKTVFRSDMLVGINLIVVALIMAYATRKGRKKYDLEHMTPERAGVIGLAQALAIVPGVSRSGITISAGLLEGFDAVAATRFSFLLSAPILLGGTLKVLAEHGSRAQISASPVLFLLGIITAFISGYWAIRFMLNYLQKHGLNLFVYYRLAIGALVIFIGLRR